MELNDLEGVASVVRGGQIVDGSAITPGSPPPDMRASRRQPTLTRIAWFSVVSVVIGAVATVATLARPSLQPIPVILSIFIGALGGLVFIVLLVAALLSAVRVIVWLVDRIQARKPRGVSLKSIRPESRDIVLQLRAITERAASRLSTTYRLQLLFVLVVGAFVVGTLGGAVQQFSSGKLETTAALGAGGVLTTLFSWLVWKPLERLEQIQRLATDAELVVPFVTACFQANEQISDSRERSAAHMATYDWLTGHMRGGPPGARAPASGEAKESSVESR